MINIHREIKAQKLDARMTMQVHDELVFDVPHDEVEIIKPIIIHNMKTAINTRVPIMVEVGTGANWLEAHERMCRRVDVQMCEYFLMKGYAAFRGNIMQPNLRVIASGEIQGL